MKTLKKILHTAGKFYSDIFDKMFNLSRPKRAHEILQQIYCTESYYITPGGIITRNEE